MKYEVVRFALTFSEDEPVTIWAFATVGRSPVPPHGAHSIDPDRDWWYRAPTPETIAIELAKTFRRHPISMREIGVDDIPKVTRYRDAWRDDGAKIAHSMPHARALHLDNLRVYRAKKFIELDGERAAAVRKGDKKKTAEVDVKAQELADLPATLGVDSANTIEELLALWPDSLRS